MRDCFLSSPSPSPPLSSRTDLRSLSSPLPIPSPSPANARPPPRAHHYRRRHALRTSSGLAVVDLSRVDLPPRPRPGTFHSADVFLCFSFLRHPSDIHLDLSCRPHLVRTRRCRRSLVLGTYTPFPRFLAHFVSPAYLLCPRSSSSSSSTPPSSAGAATSTSSSSRLRRVRSTLRSSSSTSTSRSAARPATARSGASSTRYVFGFSLFHRPRLRCRAVLISARSSLLFPSSALFRQRTSPSSLSSRSTSPRLPHLVCTRPRRRSLPLCTFPSFSSFFRSFCTTCLPSLSLQLFLITLYSALVARCGIITIFIFSSSLGAIHTQLFKFDFYAPQVVIAMSAIPPSAPTDRRKPQGQNRKRINPPSPSPGSSAVPPLLPSFACDC